MNETKRNNIKKFYFGDYQDQLNISIQNFPRLFSNLIPPMLFILYTNHVIRFIFHLKKELSKNFRHRNKSF